MIAFVKGILEMKLNGYVVIDVGGIGYKVYMSETTMDRLGTIGDEVKVYKNRYFPLFTHFLCLNK